MKKLEILFRKFIYSLLLLIAGRKKETPVNLSSQSKVLIIRLNRIGDALVATPFVKKIKIAQNPQIDILAGRKNHFIFKNNPNIAEIIVLQRGIAGLFKTLRILNKKKYNVVIDLHDDISTTVSFLLMFSNAPMKLGLNKGNSELYTKTAIRPDPQKVHVVDRLLNIYSIIGNDQNVGLAGLNIEYFVSGEKADNARKYLSSLFDREKMLVGINITAGSEARYWGTEKFKRLADHISEIYDVNILILSAPDYAEQARTIAGDKHSFYFSEDFEQFCAVVSRLDFLFTPDTFIVHIASAFRIPLFGIYVKYNTTDIIWYPYKSDYDCIVTEEPTLDNLACEVVIDKFDNFFGNYIDEYKDS